MILPVGAGQLRVVVVDDEDDLRFLACNALASDARFEVVGEGADGNAAILIAGATQPDVVLLDLEMPWLHGAEAVPYILRGAPGALIVLWTVAPDSDRARDAMTLGASALIDKAGCGFHHLASALAGVFEEHAALAAAGVSA